MIEALHAFHFLRPIWLLALLGLPLVAWWLSRADAGERALARLVDPALLPHLLAGQPVTRRAATGLLAAGWVLATLAFAGPTWSRRPQTLYADRAAQVIALNLSPRMLARDMAPSRLDRAKYKVRDLLRSNRDGQNALVAWSGEAFVVAPLTSDASSLDELLDALAPDTMPTEGDNASQAIAQGVKLIQQAKAGGGSVVLVTDRVDPGAAAAARAALEQGVRVSVLGIGTPAGGPVPLDGGAFLHDAQGNLEMARRDDAALAAVARAGDGLYQPATDDQTDIHALHAELPQSARLAAGDARSEQWLDRGPWLLLPLLLIVALGFRRGWLLMLPLACLLAVPAPAHADGWRDLWLRPDQQAMRALKAGDAAAARRLAQDPALRAAADYRSGDYAAAARHLEGMAGSDAQYNLGNALARQGKYKEAIAAYDRALTANPDNADAKANRQAVQDWLRRQPPPRNDNGAQDSKDHQGKNGQSQDSKDHQGKNGQSQDQQGQQGQSKGQPEQGKQGQQPGKPGDASKPQQGQPGQQNQASGQGKNDDGQAKPQTPEQRAAEQARAEAARQALQKQMDQALKGKRVKGRPDQPHQLGMPDQDDPSSRLPADVRQALQRVPDDPGALLRRKFELEYRQRHGGAAGEDEQP